MNLREVLRRHSGFHVGFVVVFAVASVAGLWLLFAAGFGFLQRLGGASVNILNRLFGLFFLGLSLMLVMSSVVSSYATMYRSREIAFMMTRPFSIGRIVLYKSLEAAALSSWAFYFIIIPFVGAYASLVELSPLFSFWTLLFSIPFLILCCGVGTVVVMLAVRFVPVGLATRCAIPALLLCGLAVAALLLTAEPPGQSESVLVLTSLIPGVKLAAHPLLPSLWLSEGILSLSRGEWGPGLMLWGVLCANMLMMCLLIEALGRRIYYDGWQKVADSAGTASRKPVMLVTVDRWLSWLPSDIRTMYLKDVRVFFRDPMQWSQALIFFGLLAIYFFGMRSFHYHETPAAWRNVIVVLHVFSVSAILCSFGSRFVYPQLSLEGQGFWVLGLSPTTVRRIVLTKFFGALVSMLAVSLALMGLSTAVLAVETPARLMALGLATAVSMAVCGLSTGLGAIYLNLRQRNPAAIVSGFGGTLNLVLSLGFLLLTILPCGVVYHLHYADRISQRQLAWSLGGAALWTAALTVAATVMPLWLGIRALRRRDY